MSSIRDQIMEASLREPTQEACGFVLDSGAVVHCTNVSAAPYYTFVMDPSEAEHWWRTGRCMAMWHSHPTGPAAPSEEDILQAQTVDGQPLLFMVYSVEDEDLATYRVANGTFVLQAMESPE